MESELSIFTVYNQNQNERHGQTVYTAIRLYFKVQSDPGIHVFCHSDTIALSWLKRLLVTFANSLDTNQDRQVGPDMIQTV